MSVVMSPSPSQHRPQDLEGLGTDTTSNDNLVSPAFAVVDRIHDNPDSTEQQHTPRPLQYRAATLPTYQQVQNNNTADTPLPGVQPPEPEARTSHRTPSDEVSHGEILPAYSRNNHPTASWYANIISLALQDAAAWKSGGESVYFIPQPSVDRPKDYERSTIVPRSTMSAATSSLGNATLDSRFSTYYLSHDQTRFLDAYFEVIKLGDDDLLLRILESGLVGANTRNARFTIDNLKCPSPLMAAVKAGRRSTMVLLLEHGALVNGWDVVRVHQMKNLWGHMRTFPVTRTPLQIAAQDGKLPLVKLLMEQYQADDSLISTTDGQTALRLAADAGHRHVVDYLPLRRGGAGLRWRAKGRSAAAKIHKNVCYVGEAFRGVWHLLRLGIREIVKPVLESIWRALKNLSETFRRILRALASLARQIPECVAEIAKQTWRRLVKCVRATPRFCLELAKWCWSCMCRLWHAVEYIVSRSISLLHTTAVAIYTFFRDLTWANLWHSLSDLLTAIFVRLPITIWDLARSSWAKLVGVFISLMGCLGEVIYWLGWMLWQILIFLPKRLLALLVTVGELFGHGFHEVMICWNPKTVR